jgi:NhaA family Na+:H+ antiporter
VSGGAPGSLVGNDVADPILRRTTVPQPSANPLFGRGSWTEASRITELLRRETVGGALLLVATVLALVWANSPWAASYLALRDLKVGPAALHLDLTLGTWAADGLLAIFFFVVGLELKREFVAGDLRDPRRAALPVVAAIGGMAVPALVFVLINLRTGDGALQGWAIPTATDIAFALAVLAVISTHLPVALRTFLLTLAVVDDLLAITIIAIFYTRDLAPLMLLAALVPLGLFGWAVQRRVRSWWLLLPLAAVTWVLVHESGVHATVAAWLRSTGTVKPSSTPATVACTPDSCTRTQVTAASGNSSHQERTRRCTAQPNSPRGTSAASSISGARSRV